METGRFCMFPADKRLLGPRGRGDSYIKVTGVVVGNFEKDP